jgi:hypothetical protein
MPTLILTFLIGVLIVAISAAFVVSGGAGLGPSIAMEILKGGVALAVISAGGAIAKFVVDKELEQHRNAKTQARESELELRRIRREFASIFSEFYAIRKTYDSSVGNGSRLFASTPEDVLSFKRDLLTRSIHLEGRYGALKVQCMTFFELKHVELGTKDESVIEQELGAETDPQKRFRLQLDLLGEYYDDWRHSIEGNRRLKPSARVYKVYEDMLELLHKPSEAAHQLAAV